MSGTPEARVLALYLPQYHPIPENDAWWGPGFTEWTNVAAARPLFRGHEQPRIPADLGFYDLRLPEVRAAQAAMAGSHGIEGFCYWHYWFAGKRLLDRPFREVLQSGEPDFPFCLAWANDTWRGTWYGATRDVLIEQTYPPGDDQAHFSELLPAFTDPRHVRIDSKPVFFVFKPASLPDATAFVDRWQTLATRAGLPGLHLVGFAENENWDPRPSGFDGVVLTRLGSVFDLPVGLRARAAYSLGGSSRVPSSVAARLRRRPLRVHPYSQAAPLFLVDRPLQDHEYPCVISGWDNTPRARSDGFVLVPDEGDAFRDHVRRAVRSVADRPDERRLVVLKSWNEWAEGNYVEPDRTRGYAYLEALRESLTPSRNAAPASVGTP